MYSARILADSISPVHDRLTTMEITYPRFVHSELMTHRMFSRNAASSRAIPVQTMISHTISDPVIPISWGKNRPGMQATEEFNAADVELLTTEWLAARDQAIVWAKVLYADGKGVHKQIVNRLLEPWMWITVIVSATEWDNFFHLRCHPDAQPEIQKIAYMMRELYRDNIPQQLDWGEWHLPLIYTEDRDEVILGGTLAKISAGRCARVSYLTHDGKRDPQADIDLCDGLIKSGHWSPLEHVARAMIDLSVSSNFKGWLQMRKMYANENYVG